MAHLLAKLGATALKPSLIEGVWRKAPISAKNAARLRKESLLSGREWEFEPEARTKSWEKKPKGHRHDREKPARLQAIADNLATMDERIAAHRAARRELKVSMMDRLLSTPKQLRKKVKASQ